METIKDTKTLPMNGDLAKKFESSRNLKVSFDSSKAKIEFKDSEHKRGRMKVTLKFGAEEAEGFVNFCKLAKPDQMAQDDFVKFIFYKKTSIALTLGAINLMTTYCKGMCLKLLIFIMFTNKECTTVYSLHLIC